MSKGSPLVALRLPAEELEMIDQFLADHNAKTRDLVWTRSEFIRYAVREFFKHRKRSNAPRVRKPRPPAAGPDAIT